MAVTETPLRELLFVSYEVLGSFGPSAAADDAQGVPLSTAWGGSFTIGSRTTVDIEVYVPFLAADGANDVAQANVMVDGTAAGNIKMKLVQPCPLGSGDGAPVHGKVRLSGLTAGVHTVAVHGKVNDATTTGFIVGETINPGYLRVVEV